MFGTCLPGAVDSENNSRIILMKTRRRSERRRGRGGPFLLAELTRIRLRLRLPGRHSAWRTPHGTSFVGVYSHHALEAGHLRLTIIYEPDQANAIRLLPVPERVAQTTRRNTSEGPAGFWWFRPNNQRAQVRPNGRFL